MILFSIYCIPKWRMNIMNHNLWNILSKSIFILIFVLKVEFFTFLYFIIFFKFTINVKAIIMASFVH